MNKRLAARLPCSGVLLPEDGVSLEGVTRKPSPLTNGIVAAGSGAQMPQLIARGADPTYDLLRKPKLDSQSLSAPGSPPDS